MRTLLHSILSVTLLSALSGCSSFEKMPNPFSGVNSEPRRSVAVWSPAARVVNGVPERGFAARVTFFNNGTSKKGVKIDGDIVVFAFDEYPGRSASNNTPDKSYPFLAEDMKKLHSYSKELGHSYNLWIPWDNAGPDGERKTVSLIVKLVQKNGSSVMSGQAKCVLPGKEPVFTAKNAHAEGEITQVNYRFGRNDRYEDNLPPGFRDWTKTDRSVVTPEEREISMNKRPLKMVTTSIPIPRNTYAAVMRGDPSVNPVEFVAPRPQYAQNPQPEVPQYAPTTNPIASASYNGQPTVPQYVGPLPTDTVPPCGVTYDQTQPRTEQQGNTTITYSNEPRNAYGYSSNTNPLSRRAH